MAKCPFCDGRLSQPDIDQGRCGHCNAAFFPDAESQGAGAMSGAGQTLDSTDRSSMSAGQPRPQGVLDLRDTRTLDSAAPQPASAKPPHGPPAEVRETVPTLDGAGAIPSLLGEDGALTADSPRTDQTLDSAGSSGPSAEPCAGSFLLGGAAQTLDSGGGPALPEDKPGAGTRGSARQTVQPAGGWAGDPGRATASLVQPSPGAAEGADAAEDVAERVSMLWSGKYQAGDSPRTSIKAESQTVEQESNLVIQARVFRRTKAAQSRKADYDLLRQLGEGGMGVVLAARQASIDRLVAVKMLKPARSKDAQARQKFLSEAVVTGDLEHPNIVPVYDVGSDDSGALFYSMKCVKGTPWNKVIGEKSVQENLEILMKAADAVAFAHSRGVIHRDLKPENVMLGDFGEVLVMDWGLALAVGPGAAGASMAGTPAYMAPEMAVGPVERCGLTSDVYLLGAILYEIIAGFPPHAGDTVLKCLFAASKNKISPTEKTGELVDIALKAMATDPEDRYATVGEFQNAIRQYQSHSQSVLLSTRAAAELEEADKRGDYETYARSRFAFQEAYALWEGNTKAAEGVVRASAAYARTALARGDYDLGASLLNPEEPAHQPILAEIEAARRERDARQQRLRAAKRIGAALAATVFLVVTVAFFWIRAEADRARRAEHVAESKRQEAVEQREIADQQREEAKRQTVVADTQRGEAVRQRNIAEQQRTKAQAAQRVAESAQKKEEYGAYIARIGLASAKIEENAFDLAIALLDECPPYLRDWEWGRLMHLCTQDIRTFDARQPVETVGFSPDGKRFATGGWGGIVRIWDAGSGKELAAIPSGGQYVFGLAFSPNGRQLAVGTNDRPNYLKVFDASTGGLVKSLAGHGDAVLSVAYSRDGKSLLTSSYDNTARLWNVASGESRVFEGHEWWVWSAAFSPDEKRIVTACQDGSAMVWSVDSRRPGAPFLGHVGPVYAAVFSTDGKQVASAGYDKRILLWDPEKVQPFDFSALAATAPRAPTSYDALEGHTAAVRSVRFSDRGKLLISAGNDNAVRVWDVATRRPLKTLRGHAGRVLSCAFAPDNAWVLSGSHDHLAKLWSIAGYEEVRVLRGRLLEGHRDAILGAAFSPDGRHIVSASRDRSAKLWDVATGRELRQLKDGHEFLVTRAAFFGGGKRLVTAAVDNTTRIWDVATGAQLFALEGTGSMAAVALSSDGRLLLTGSDDKTAKLWDLESGRMLRKLDKQPSEVTAVAISPDNRLLLTGDARGRCRLWDADTGALRWQAGNHSRAVTGALFLPSGEAVLTASIDNTVAQWDVQTGRERLPWILKHPDSVVSLAISPDGRRLLTACADKVVRLWDSSSGRQLGVLAAGSEAVNAAEFSPDGRRAVTTDAKGNVRLWDVESQREIRTGAAPSAPFLRPRSTTIQAWSAIFSPDGSQILTIGGNEACLWDVKQGRPNVRFSPHNSVASARFSPDGKRVVTGSWDKSARIWNAEKGVAELRLEGGHSQYVNDAAFSPDGSKVVTAGDDKTACIWDARSGKLLQTLHGHRDRIGSALFSPDGTRVLTASNDKTARIWNAQTGGLLLELVGHEQAVLHAAFSHDGTRVITGGEDNRAKLWDSRTGKEAPFSLEGHTAGVTAVALSPNGRRAVTGSLDNTAKVWDAQTGKEILTLKGHTQEITTVGFSPDGRCALTGSRDGTLILWMASPWRGQEPPARATASHWQHRSDLLDSAPAAGPR